MSAGLIELIGNDILCSIEGVEKEARFAVGEARPKLEVWAQRYDEAVRVDNEGELASIGREMFAWLDGSGWASEWANRVGDDLQLEIKVEGNGAQRKSRCWTRPGKCFRSGKLDRWRSTNCSCSSSCAVSAIRLRPGRLATVTCN